MKLGMLGILSVTGETSHGTLMETPSMEDTFATTKLKKVNGHLPKLFHKLFQPLKNVLFYPVLVQQMDHGLNVMLTH